MTVEAKTQGDVTEMMHSHFRPFPRTRSAPCFQLMPRLSIFDFDVRAQFE